MGNCLSKEVACEKCLIYEEKCREYDRHIEKMRKLYRETLEIHEREVDAIEKFYIESVSDVAMKVIEEEREKSAG